MPEITARFVALDGQRVLAPGCIRWDANGRVVALRRARAGARVRDVAVLPGLVNAHAHLQLAPLEQPVRHFLPWVRAVMTARDVAGPSGWRNSLRAAARKHVEEGVLAVGEVDSTGLSLSALRSTPLIGRVYRELTGFHLDAAGARSLLAERRKPAAPPWTSGWSPHAPYSVSAALLRAAVRDRRHLAIHCAEIPEEQQLLRRGDGPFRELLEQLGRWPVDFRAPGVGAVRYLERVGALRRGTHLVHCQELERGDSRRIAAAGVPIVVCPGTIEYFRRSPPPVPAWLAAGIRVGLGTDSPASNTATSLRLELSRAALAWPQLSPVQLLAMATTHGAAALGLAAGALRRGRRADFLVVEAGADWPRTLEAFVHGQSRTCEVHAAGRRVLARSRR